MGSFEWMELQTLTGEIGAARTRLSEARAKRDHRLARTLEEEIAAAEKKRAGLLANITSHLAGVPEAGAAGAPAAPAAAVVAVKPERHGSVPAAGTLKPAAVKENLDHGEGEQPPLELTERIVGTGTRQAAPAPKVASAQGGTIVWDQLRPSDIERARQELGTRRAELLARHAEELRGLDAEQSQLDTLVESIDAFMRRFSTAAPDADVVQLGPERERLQRA